MFQLLNVNKHMVTQKITQDMRELSIKLKGQGFRKPLYSKSYLDIILKLYQY